MKKLEPWGLIIVDGDQKKYAFTGIIADDRPWNDRVCEEQDKGRHIRCLTCTIDHLPMWSSSNPSLSKTSVDDILSPPKNIPYEYVGVLPQYAKGKNRRRLVKILCRGRCCCTRLAELDRDNPGMDCVKNAKDGIFHATCLVCGYRAIDNYNWQS